MGIVISREEAREGLMRGVNNKRNLCESLRLVYDEVHDTPDNEEITELLVEAYTSAKKMQNRLSYYQKKYKDNTGNKAESIVGIAGVNDRARMRKARKL